MIYANLTYIQKNLDNVPKWIQKDWCHGSAKGKGKPIANRERWQKLSEYLKLFEIVWMWNPKCSSFQSVIEKANSMALLSTRR